MSTNPTPKTAYVILAAGIAIGAVSMAGMTGGMSANKALAQSPDVSVTSRVAPRVIAGTTTESTAALHNLDESMANLADFVAPAVVHITSVTERRQGASGEYVPIKGGQGSGFIYRPDGYIITNDHVVGGYDKVTVILKDGREFKGKVIRGEDSDIAIVKIDAKDLPTLAFADSGKVRPGQLSMAIGAPFGLEQSVTIGHVSALGRINQIEDKLYPDLIQTDTAINMGNSGGPLVNIDGQVIGINTAIFSPTGVNSGIGFAIPANQARMIAEKLVTDGKLTRSMIKLVPENLKEYEKKELGLEGGARATGVQSDGPAAAAGIKDGDIIVKIGDVVVNSQLDLRNAMLTYRPGTTVPVEVIRNKERKTFNVKLVPYVKPKLPTAPQIRQMPEGGPDFKMPRTPEDLREFFKDLPNMRGDDDEAPVPQIREGKARLGITVEAPSAEMRKQFSIPSRVEGAVVTSVQPGSVAFGLGLKVGDVVTEFAGKKIRNAQDLIEVMKSVNWGDKKSLTYRRYSDGGETNVTRDVKF